MTAATGPLAPRTAAPGSARLQRQHGRREYPASFSQREMWAQCQLHADRPLNNLAAEVSLEGPLDARALGRAFDAVMDRHEALRTVFPARDGEPVQQVEPSGARLLIRDASAVPLDARDRHVRARTEELVGHPFRLDRAPLVRAELLQFDPAYAVLIFVYHHLVLDAYCLPGVLQDLTRAYEAAAAGAAPALAPLALQYGDFAVWQERALDAGAFDGHAGFWQEQLRPPLPAPIVPGDRQPASARTFAIDAVTWRLPETLASGVATLCQRHRTTPFRVFAAVLQILVQRLTGEDDLLLAVAFSARPDGADGPAGMFSNTLPLRMTIDRAAGFDRLLAALTAQLRDARAHREFPLLRALRGVELPRNPHRPLLPTCVSQVRPFGAVAGGVRFRLGLPIARCAPFDLWLVTDVDGAELAFHFAAELFAPDTMQALVRSFEALLASAVADPSQPAGALGLCSDDERSRVTGWGRGDAPPAWPPGGVAAAWTEAARQHAGRVAVVDTAGATSYHTLHRASSGVAAALGAVGVAREDRVGILGTRSAGMVAAVLGTLSAGAAFVPLERRQPDQRLLTIRRASSLTAVLADRAALARARELTAGTSIRVVCWDDAIDAAAAGETRTDAPVTPADLAYIFSTSGSTGAPKGVMVEQRALWNHLQAKRATLGLDAASVVAQTASYGFDIVVWQWLAPLLSGGRVVIYDDATAEDPARLLAGLARDGVTVVETIPGFLDALADAATRPGAPALPALRWMVSNAEALPAAVARRWLAACPAARLLNTYGATECGDDTTHGEVPVAIAVDERVPVGEPIPGAVVVVVDERLRPVPPGVPGDVLLGGTAVGRGYLGDPAATAAAFIPDPWSAVPGARLYRTGDRGRWRADGRLECLGRTDHQVKVHGYRVELAEVEAALAAIPGLTQVAASVRTDAQGRRRLVAYYVASAPHDATALRHAVSTRLPGYMVPDAWVWLDALPRTHTGKLHRAALPEPPPERGGRSTPPATPLEAAIAAAWREVLQVGAVGRDDNFFDLGGDSIQGIRVAGVLRERGHAVEARAIFTHQTVAELADLIDRSARVTAATSSG